MSQGIGGSGGPARSWLFVPATRPDRFAKAAASGADRVILDLEDAVAPNEKIEARRGLASATIPHDVPVYVRLNSALTPWFEDDLAVARTLAIRGVLLPKADSAAHVERAVAAIGPQHTIVPIIETAVALWNVLEVARSPRVERLIFGALDFTLDTGIHDADGAFDAVRSRIVLASRVAGIAPPVDLVTLAIDDQDLLKRHAARSRSFGFAGKLCIHPKQIAVTNAAFRPSDEEVAWARGVLDELAARPGAAVFAYQGELVDRPVIQRAREIVAAGDGRVSSPSRAEPRATPPPPPGLPR
jgi:citrate lyase subunit beta/citryl-CoA lyase